LTSLAFSLRGSRDVARSPLILQVFLLAGRELLKVAVGILLRLLHRALRRVVAISRHGPLRCSCRSFITRG
jgi:hypothetical protein